MRFKNMKEYTLVKNRTDVKNVENDILDTSKTGRAKLIMLEISFGNFLIFGF